MARSHRVVRCALVALAGLSAVAAAARAAQSDLRALALVLDEGRCIGCHGADGVASDTRLVFPPYDASPERVREFGEWLLELVDLERPDESRLLRKPTGRMSHGGGERVPPGSKDEVALRAWVRELAAGGGSGRAADAAAQVLRWVRRPEAESGGRVLRRLTARWYDNTVRDLLGDQSGPGRSFPPEDFVDGFQNQHLGQTASPVLIEAYSQAAQLLADNAVRAIERGDPHRLLPCRPPARAAGARGAVWAASDRAACAAEFVARFGRRAFRRPLLPSERQVFAALVTSDSDFLGGVRTVIEAMLQSPSFLYLLDTGRPEHAAYARAARLSYALWGTMPDDWLLAQAELGKLRRAPDLEAVVRAMLEHPRAVAAMDDFAAQWLRLDGALSSFKDRRVFRAWTPDLARAMVEETRALVRHLIWEDRDFTELFTARYTFALPELARLYGLPAPEPGERRLAYPEDSPRSGILGHASFLAATSKPSETSPTARGLYIREHFLCQTTPPPPPSVNMDLPAFAGDRPLTARERMAMHLTDPACAGCHQLIDPIGYAFERFDALGAYSDKMRVIYRPPNEVDDDGNPLPQKPSITYELEVDTRGVVLGLADAEFDGPRDIGRILARSESCHACIARQLFRYVMGRREGAADEQVLKSIVAAFRGSGFRFKELLVTTMLLTELEIEATLAVRAPGGAEGG